ncbi:MAG TPA: long-chain fatty acid--CoA ligase [bacterium]|nr:long-chain fatty acid--CoA ligase [bacterium]
MERRPWHAAYDDGVPTSVDYEETTLAGFLAASAGSGGDRSAVRFMNCVLTYAQLDDAVDRFAAVLLGLGLRTGDRVAIQLPNLPQSVIAFLGTLRAGGAAVMTNPLYTQPELVHQWNDAGCRIAVTADFLYEKTIAGVRDKLPVRHFLIASIPEYLRFPLNLLAPLKLKKDHLIAKVPEAPDLLPFRKSVESARPLKERPSVDLDDLAALQYTGGTTGVAKGAMLSHRNLAFQAQQLRAWLPDIQPGREVFLSALPFFHVFGLTVAMSLPVRVAAEMVLLPNPRDVARLIDSINKHKVTIFPVVPAMVHGINHHPKAKTLEVKSLKMCVSGSAPMPEDTLRHFEKLTGGKIVEGYGLTEASPVTHVNPNRGKRKVNTIGLPIPDTDCRIRPMGTDAETGAEGDGSGELLIRGPQVMQGYWNRPDDTADTLKDGWLHTGDLATMDDDGYFRIVGRAKEIIICSGYKVYPDEVDRALIEHEDVLESATIGIPDEKRGESVKSFVVLRPGAKVSEQELRDFCRDKLAAFKIPRQVAFRKELPKSAALKILRRQLLEEELAGENG